MARQRDIEIEKLNKLYRSQSKHDLMKHATIEYDEEHDYLYDKRGDIVVWKIDNRRKSTGKDGNIKSPVRGFYKVEFDLLNKTIDSHPVHYVEEVASLAPEFPMYEITRMGRLHKIGKYGDYLPIQQSSFALGTVFIKDRYGKMVDVEITELMAYGALRYERTDNMIPYYEPRFNDFGTMVKDEYIGDNNRSLQCYPNIYKYNLRLIHKSLLKQIKKKSIKFRFLRHYPNYAVIFNTVNGGVSVVDINTGGGIRREGNKFLLEYRFGEEVKIRKSTINGLKFNPYEPAKFKKKRKRAREENKKSLDKKKKQIIKNKWSRKMSTPFMDDMGYGPSDNYD